MNFDSRDWTGMRAMMDECKTNPDKYRMPFYGVNDDMESVTVEVYDEKIITYTTQTNNWIRQNVYWYDGTVEELYDGRIIREKAEENLTVCPCCGQYIPPAIRERLQKEREAL